VNSKPQPPRTWEEQGWIQEGKIYLSTSRAWLEKHLRPPWTVERELHGVETPLTPPFAPGFFCHPDVWIQSITWQEEAAGADMRRWKGWELMTGSAWQSAHNAGHTRWDRETPSRLPEPVFQSRALGPRGGVWYAITSDEAWRAWAERYVENVKRRLAGEAARALGYDAERR
jgi:hypothetical protein